MPRYLFEVSYTAEGLKSVVEAGPASRVHAVEALAASVGGTVATFDFAFGKTDVYTIVDLPDDEAAAAVALKVGASGVISKLHTVKLLTAEQMETAAGRKVDYRPPGT